MRQSGSHDDQRSGVLTQFVARTADRRHVVRTEVLHLVDEQGDSHPDVPSEAGGVHEQFDQVDLDVTGIGATFHRRCVDSGLPAFAHPFVRCGAQSERFEYTEEVVDGFGIRMCGRDLTHRHVQGRRQRASQTLVRARLDLARTPALGYGSGAQVIEQNGFPDTAQTGEHDAAFGPAAGDALENDVERRELLLSAGEFGRALPRAGGVRVADRIHRSMVTSCAAVSGLL